MRSATTGEVDLVGDDDHGHAPLGEVTHHGQHFTNQLRVQRAGGPSNSMAWGRMARARAIATRCCW